MKASELNPTAWDFALRNPKAGILMRRWLNIRKKASRLEDLMLELMSNPSTTPEQLSTAATLYANLTKQMLETVNAIDKCLYNRESTHGDS